MRQLGSRVNLIPVIAKADSITRPDLLAFKERIKDCISALGIEIYSCPVQSDDEESTRRNTSIMVRK